MGAPDLGVVFVGEIAAGGPELGHDASARHQRHAADNGQRDCQVAVQGAVTAAEEAEVLMQAPFAGGEYAAELLHLGVGYAADLKALFDVDAAVHLPGLVEIANVFIYVVPVLPAFVQNHGYQRAQQQRVGAGAGHYVHIRHSGGLAHAGVDVYEEPVRILRRIAYGCACSGDLVCNKGVAAPEDDHLGVDVVRLQKADLVAEDLAVAPPVAHKFKADGVEHILSAQALYQRTHEHQLALVAAGGAADAADGARAVGVRDIAQPVADLADGLVPAYAHKLVAFALHGVVQPVAVLDEILAVTALAAAVAVRTGARLVGAAGYDLPVLYLDVQSAAHAADGALGFLPFTHKNPPLC